MTDSCYYHACCECGFEACEFDKNLQGKALLIEDEKDVWFCRECWKQMDAEREAKYTESAA